MHRLFFVMTALICLLSPAGGTPELASKIQETWELAVTKWKADAQKAVTPEQRAKIVESRPNAAAYASRMWGVINKSLTEPWTIQPAAWFLQVSQSIRNPDKPGLLFANQIEATKKAILEHHARRPDPQLNTLCIALTRLSDPLSLSILEKIESTNPDPKIQGVAALSAAMVIKNLGDDAELMRKRLSYIRKAIINSAEVEIGDTSIAQLAENELYQIRFLSKGRVAPDFKGVDSSGQSVQLSGQRGKVVILVFWSTTIPNAEHVIELTNEMAAKFRNKPVTVIGINHDKPDKLKSLRADGAVTWRNISDPENPLAKEYRVGTWPMVYVLDHKQRIHHAGGLGSFAELTADALVAELP